MDTWIWIVVALLLGVLLGGLGVYLFARRRWADAVRAEELQRELDGYRQEVSDHFVQTAELVNGLTRSYKAVYDHLEQGAYRLVDEETLRKQLGDVDAETVRLEYIGRRNKAAVLGTGGARPGWPVDQGTRNEEPLSEGSPGEGSPGGEPLNEGSPGEGPLNEEPLPEESAPDEALQEEPLSQDPLRQESPSEEPLHEDARREEPLREEPLREEPLSQEPLQEEPLHEGSPIGQSEGDAAETPEEREEAARTDGPSGR